MRCNDCNKFVSQEAGEPEVNDLEYADGCITGSVRITQCCAECSSELKEAYLDIDMSDIQFCSGPGHEVEVEGEAEATDKSEGKGRYSKTFYGATANLTLKCSCGKTTTAEWEDYCQASSMDECQ